MKFCLLDSQWKNNDQVSRKIYAQDERKENKRTVLNVALNVFKVN